MSTCCGNVLTVRLGHMPEAFIPQNRSRRHAQSSLCILKKLALLCNIGYLYCNGPSFNATTGEKVRFYVSSLGTEADLHTPSSSLQWTQRGHRSSALLNLPGQMQTADIVPRAAGEFYLQCRTAEHVDAGMIAKLRVEDSGLPPLLPLKHYCAIPLVDLRRYQGFLPCMCVPKSCRPLWWVLEKFVSICAEALSLPLLTPG